MEGELNEQELYDKSFIEEPAILDKHKAAAVIVDGKFTYLITFISLFLKLTMSLKIVFLMVL